jgi:hypothetical protein
MGYSVFPAPVASSKTPTSVTLTSGTSWTVPSGVTSITVTRCGGEAATSHSGYGTTGGTGGTTTFTGLSDAVGGIGWASNFLNGGQMNDRSSPVTLVDTIATTPGASIAYSIGAAGTSGGSGSYVRRAGFITIEYWT